MRVKAIKYTRYPGTNKEWKLVGKDIQENEDYAYFGLTNLFVAKNGAGKSRTLDVIRELSEFISNKKRITDSTFSTQIFDFIFLDNDNKDCKYLLDIRERKVYQEKLLIDEVVVFDTKNKILPPNFSNLTLDDESLIINQQQNSKYISKDLFIWGLVVKTFFANQWVDLSENITDIEIKDFDFRNLNVDTPSFVISVFSYGLQEYGQSYIDQVLSYANRLDMNLSDIEVKKGRRGYRLYVEEDGKYYVEQSRLSSRVFRALSLLIVLVLVKRKNLPACLLIDDIGDGFDTNNAKSYIDLIMNICYNSSIQIFMTSTNRLILNNVHLKNWSIIDRVGNKSIIYNIHNSTENFEDFKYTSLNNTDFYSTDFYKYGFENDDDQ